MHEGSLQTNASDMVISLGLRAAVPRAETCHVACFEIQGQVRNWGPVTLTVTLDQCENEGEKKQHLKFSSKNSPVSELQDVIHIHLDQTGAYNGNGHMLKSVVII